MKYDLPDLDWFNSHELLAGVVVPRPIALVSTVGKNGVFNAAPFSFYGIMSVKPAIVYLGILLKRRKQEKKHTIKNIMFSKDFVINVVDEQLAERMNKCSAEFPEDISEFNEAGLTPSRSDLIKSPIVAESPINMECKLLKVNKFGRVPDYTDVVIGEVLRVHVRDNLFVDGILKMSKLKAIGRLNEELYCRTANCFEIKRPYDGLS